MPGVVIRGHIDAMGCSSDGSMEVMEVKSMNHQTWQSVKNHGLGCWWDHGEVYMAVFRV